MKVLVVVHDYLPAHLGGTELHAHQLALRLLELGHEVLLASTERDSERSEGELVRRTHEGVPVVELIHQREYAHAHEAVRSPFAPRCFEQVLAEYGPDVVHFHHLAHWGAECLALAARTGAATLVTLHDYWLLCQAATLLRSDGELCTEGVHGRCADCLSALPFPAVEGEPDAGGDDPARRLRVLEGAAARHAVHRHFLRAAQAVVSPSRFLIDRFDEAGFLDPARRFVLKTGYPGPVRPLREAPRGTLRVGYVGGVYPSKGVHVAVAAFCELRDVDAELRVHGVLEWFPDYVDELRTMAGSARVRFEGPFDPREVDRVFGELDLLVVPSVWYENMPITIHEAFRNALPVLASDLGGMAEAVREGQGGGLFPRGDAGALAARIRELEADRQRLVDLARGRPQVPTVDQVADRLLELYAACVDERRAAGPGPAEAVCLDDLRP